MHVAQKEEADRGDGHNDFGHPERRVPAVLFGDSVEWESCHKSSDCRNRNKTIKGEPGAAPRVRQVVPHHLPSEPQQHETFHRNVKVHFHWRSPQTTQLDHRRKTQTWRRGRGSRSGQERFLFYRFYSADRDFTMIYLIVPLFLRHQPEVRWDE